MLQESAAKYKRLSNGGHHNSLKDVGSPKVAYWDHCCFYFERSILFQGAKTWNNKTIEERNTATHKEFKRKQKCELNTLLSYQKPNNLFADLPTSPGCKPPIALSI